MSIKPYLSKVTKSAYLIPGCLVLILFGIYYFQLTTNQTKTLSFNNEIEQLKKEKSILDKELSHLKNEDQFKKNEALQKEITAIEETYTRAVSLYEQIQDLRAQKKDTTELEKELAAILNFLSVRNYASASATLDTLNKEITQLTIPTPTPTSVATNSTSPSTPAITANNTPPSSGYSRQTVQSEVGSFTVDIVSADLNSTRVIVDTASDSDCHDNCPVLSLSDYVSRNGAFAGINGSYFCPASYPSCAGKTNSFDTLLMNKNKIYFNSDNNVYSTVPVAVFGNGFARFIGASSQWGRDTSVDGVIANQPLLLSGGNVVFGGDGDPKKGSIGTRSFVGNKGSTVYIGVVHSATVAEVAYVLKALGLENALNLDSGGSTALWSGGYKAGPGRNIPNAILFVGK